MDPLEQWYKDHKEALDTLEPRPDSWAQLGASLDQTETVAKTSRPRRYLRMGGAVAVAASLLLGLFFYLPSKQQLAPPPPLPDINLLSSEGQAVALSSLKGQVVLLEFWASWCNVCREKNCNDLLPIYDEYKHKGFEIYAVSLDSITDQWLYGIERDKLPWIQVSDPRGFASPVSQSFGVDKTPTTFLLDQNHEVIGKNLSREDLRRKLDMCYRK